MADATAATLPAVSPKQLSQLMRSLMTAVKMHPIYKFVHKVKSTCSGRQLDNGVYGRNGRLSLEL